MICMVNIVYNDSKLHVSKWKNQYGHLFFTEIKKRKTYLWFAW